MIRFEFSTEDLPEEDRYFFKDLVLEIERGDDFDAEQMLGKFKKFLDMMEYQPGTIEKIQFKESLNGIDKDILKYYMEAQYNANE